MLAFGRAPRPTVLELYDYIARESGAAVALGYVDRIEAACMALSKSPKRGRAKEAIFPGLRVVGFERRAIIAFVVREREVVIARILYGGRDVDRLLPGVGEG